MGTKRLFVLMVVFVVFFIGSVSFVYSINPRADCQLCRRYADGNRRDSTPWSCVNFDDTPLLTDFVANVDWNDDFDLKVNCVDPLLQTNCQLCKRYADGNRRDSTPWSCVNFDDTPLLTDFVANVDWNDDFDLKVNCVDPLLQTNCQLCRRYADANRRDSTPWSCVNFDDTPLLTDFVANVDWNDDFDLKVNCQCECSSGECCDGCYFRPDTYECRQAVGGCDVAEYCSAASADCPIDVFEAFGTACSIGACDGAGNCLDCDASEDICNSEGCRGVRPLPFFFFPGVGCCGDDINEYYNNRGGEIIDVNDNACCDSAVDCVYNNLCYNGGGLYILGEEARYCTNGGWGAALKQKCDWNNESCDYCDNDLNCLTPQKQCINSGDFVEDHLCENGEWTSRTKLIALQLLDIAGQITSDDYTLFCDKYENTLNYYQYQIGGVSVTQHLSEVNNFCVLKLPEQVIFGASLNVPIDGGGFIDSLSGVGDCDNAVGVDDGKFHQCNSGSPKAWYNNKIQSVIYSDKSILNNPSEFEVNAWEIFLTFLKNPFQKTFNFLLGLIEQKPELQVQDYKFIEGTKDFSRIYLDKKNIRSIWGVAEKVEPIGGEYFSVVYGMYSDDICSTVNAAYERFKPSQMDLILCYYDARTRTYYVVSNHSAALALWPDLTAKLRTRMPPILPMQYCFVRESCEDEENAILSLSGVEDAHASVEGQGGFGYRLCCPNSFEIGSSSDEELVRLSGVEDAHASIPNLEINPFNQQIFIGGTSGYVNCESVVYPGGCYPDEICVISLSDIVDAHVSSCEDTQFKVRVCCKVESVPGIEGGQIGADQICIDSDGGLDYYDRGIIYLNSNLGGEDYCEEGQNTLVEYYCYSDGIGVDNYECPNGCENGACIQ